MWMWMWSLPADFDDMPIDRQYRLIKILEGLRASAIEFAAKARALAEKNEEPSS